MYLYRRFGAMVSGVIFNIDVTKINCFLMFWRNFESGWAINLRILE